jgi:hypothetical protein
LALIVAGVSIALAAGAWYDGLGERADEREVLRQLAAALEVDREGLTTRYETEQQVVADVRALLDQVESDAPYSPDMRLDFGAVRRWV